MATTLFVDTVTLTAAAWFNDTDTVTYGGLTSISGTNTITAAGPASMTAYAARQRFIFIPAASNTGAATINITPSGSTALGAKNIFYSGAALTGGELKIGVPAIIIYDGAQFSLISSAISTSVPAGTMLDFGGTTVPTGFLGCDGSAVSRTTFAGLFAAISTIWGTGDGSTTFNLPNFQRRVAVGSGGSGTATLGNAVGNTGGEETHTQTIAEMPAHTHTENSPTGGGNGYTNTTNFGATTANIATGSTGGGTAFNVLQPSGIVLKIIKT